MVLTAGKSRVAELTSDQWKKTSTKTKYAQRDRKKKIKIEVQIRQKFCFNLKVSEDVGDVVLLCMLQQH